MTEEECITFYRELLKAAPWLLQKSDSEITRLLSDVFKTLSNRSATREHIGLALARVRKNKKNRAGNFKQRYITKMFLHNPLISLKEVQKTIKAAFYQRTRWTVIRDCLKEAERLSSTLSEDDIEKFINDVDKEFAKKAKEPNVLQ